MKLYFVRHGQRGWGESYDTLTDWGIEQARRIGLFFKGKKIDCVYCSPQKRARLTWKQIKPYLPNASFKIVRALKQQGVPEEVGEDVIKKLGVKRDTEEELDRRIFKFLRFLLKKHKNDVVLLITHKKPILSAISWLLGIPPTERRYFMKIVPEASITYFELDGANVKKFRIGETSHILKFVPDVVKKRNKQCLLTGTVYNFVDKNDVKEMEWLKENYKNIKREMVYKNYRIFELNFKAQK